MLGELREQIALPLIAKLAISAHSEASVRSFSSCACMSFMDGPCEETSYPRERLLTSQVPPERPKVYTAGSVPRTERAGPLHVIRSMEPGAGLRTTIPDVPSVFIQPDHRGFAMIEGDFNSRTLANVEMALDRVCGNTPLGEQYDVRKRVAEAFCNARDTEELRSGR